MFFSASSTVSSFAPHVPSYLDAFGHNDLWHAMLTNVISATARLDMLGSCRPPKVSVAAHLQACTWRATGNLNSAAARSRRLPGTVQAKGWMRDSKSPDTDAAAAVELVSISKATIVSTTTGFDVDGGYLPAGRPSGGSEFRGGCEVARCYFAHSTREIHASGWTP